MQRQASACTGLLLLLLLPGQASAQPNGYYDVAPPGQAPVPVATGNDYAPTPAGAAIVLRTDLTLRLTTSQSFIGTSQTNFATAMRSLLAPYGFMSVAVTGFASGSDYVDVTTRLVDFPSDAGTLAGIWYTIAQQIAVNQTLLPSLQSLLGAFNVSSNVTLESLQGSPDVTQARVNMAVDLTVGQAQSAFQASTATQPIATFLGDHVSSVTVGNTTAGASNQVVATVNLQGLAPDQIPQLMLFLANSSDLGTPAVPVSTTGYQVISETPAPTAAPSPPPAPGPVYAPPPMASATTNSTPATPNNPDVDLNIAMRIFGSQVVPFTASAQFVAASALAGVFSIVLGKGTVQVLSSAAAPPGSMPTTSAASGARKLLSALPELPEVHVRSLLQAAPTPGTAPAVDVVFSVNLPTASQNSLLIVQSTSPVVRAQFAGWFVYTMSGEGYNINAEIVNITTVSVGAPAPAPSSGGSSHAGAIAGGVVGGVVALALIALAAFFVLRAQRRRGRQAGIASPPSVTPSEQKLMQDDDLNDMPNKGGKDSTFTMDILHTPNDSGDIIQTGPSAAYMHSPGRSTRSGTMTGTSSDNAQSLDARSKGTDGGYSSSGLSDIDRLHHRRSQRKRALSTGSSSDASMQSLLSSLDALRPGSLFMDRYLVEKGARRGAHTALIYGQDRDPPNAEVAIKFFPGESQARHVHEKLFFDNRMALEPETVGEHVEVLLGTFSAHRSVLTEESVPPSLVYERGAYTLHEWLGGAAKLAGRPEDAERIRTVHQLCSAVDYLHQRRLVHRGLTPRAVMHFASLNKWKLTSMAGWARIGDACPMENYDIRYAAPELLAADLRGEDDVQASVAADLWAVGAMAFEVLCGRQLFPPSMDDHAIVGALLQLEGFKLPWEQDVAYFQGKLSPAACSLVQDLLVRAPNARKPLRTALHSPLFNSLKR